MGVFDQIKSKVEEVASEHGEQIDAAVDKATDKLDELTGGKTASISEKIDQAVDTATDKLSGAPANAEGPADQPEATE